MKKKNIFKYSTLFIILGIVLVFIVVVSTSYAFFTTTVKGKELVIKTGTLAVNYAKKTDVINLTNLYPMTNSEGLNQTPHKFSITNNGNITARYQIRLEIDNNDKNQIPLEYIKMSYKKDDSEYSNPVLLSDLNSSLVILKDVVINPEEVNNYGIKLWIDLSAPNDIQNKTFKAKVVVDSIQDVEDGYVMNTIPIINLNKDKNNNIDINLKVGETYTELGVESVEDDTDILTVNQVTKTYEYFDGTNLTTVESIDTSKTGIYYVTYSITDSNNNIGKSIRIVTVNNTSTIPTITLNGDATITLGERDYYKENGVTVQDNNKVITIGEVKTKVVGTYIVRYIVVDSNNNLNSVVRTVNVIKPYEELILNGTDPVLTDNLVPIKIQDDGTVKKASTLSEWYDYETKQWANAVVLKEENVIDYSGNARHAKTVGGPTYSEEGLVLDGGNDGIYIGSLVSDLFKSSNTFQIKVKRDETNVRDILFGNYNLLDDNDVDGYNYEVRVNNTYRVWTDDNASDIENGVATYNKFVLITFIYDKDNNKISVYEDDKLVANMTSKVYSSFNRDFNKAYIGKDYRNDHTALKGTIERVMIYDDILTLDEIKQNISTEYAKVGTDGVVEDNLLLFYDFRKTSNDVYTENDVVINEDAIESYFVWIPKYSYQLWDLGNYSSLTSIDSTKPHAIPIKFGTTNTSDTNTGECTTPMNDNGTQGLAGESGNCKVGDYMTHPAFLAFDSEGFWVGKFETGYDGATSTSAAQINSSDSNKIIIKPNVYSWRNITVGNMFKVSYDYLRSDESHMMKNTEWGAVAYLSHSNHGINKEIRINNNSNFITGYSGTEQPTLGNNKAESIEGNRLQSTPLSTDGTYTINYLNNNSVVSSTTGNYSGIYDTSGGAWDYVMGYTIGATTVDGSSGVTSLYEDFYTNINYEKYYDKYSSKTTTSFNNRILGDATGELGPYTSQTDPDTTTRYKSSWYTDFSFFVDSVGPWFDRGCYWSYGSNAGIFAFDNNTGGISTNVSFRIVLTPNN